jgi:hypothetical protein
MMVQAVASTKDQVVGFPTVVAVASAESLAVVFTRGQAVACIQGQAVASPLKWAGALMLASKGLSI